MSQDSQLYTVDVVDAIVSAYGGIEAITIREFPPPPDFELRFLPSGNDRELMNSAMTLRASTGVPFPEAILIQILSDGNPSPGYLEALRYHHTLGTSYTLTRAEVLGGTLRSIEKQSRISKFVGVSSRVFVADKTVRHIPQLDFHIPPSTRSLIIVEQILGFIAPCGGWILNSGKSYHFFGDELIDQESVLRFLSLALLYTPLIDKNWIAHQILEGACTLRLFENPRTGAGAPTVVKKLTRSGTV